MDPTSWSGHVEELQLKGTKNLALALSEEDVTLSVLYTAFILYLPLEKDSIFNHL